MSASWLRSPLGLPWPPSRLAMISREMAEPFVLAILGGLAVVGVFCLFAGAVGILHFGQNQARNDVTKAFVDNLPQGALDRRPERPRALRQRGVPQSARA